MTKHEDEGRLLSVIDLVWSICHVKQISLQEIISIENNNVSYMGFLGFVEYDSLVIWSRIVMSMLDILIDDMPRIQASHPVFLIDDITK